MRLSCLKCDGEGDPECEECEGSGNAKCESRGCRQDAIGFNADGKALCEDCIAEEMIEQSFPHEMHG